MYYLPWGLWSNGYEWACGQTPSSRPSIAFADEQVKPWFQHSRNETNHRTRGIHNKASAKYLCSGAYQQRRTIVIPTGSAASDISSWLDSRRTWATNAYLDDVDSPTVSCTGCRASYNSFGYLVGSSDWWRGSKQTPLRRTKWRSLH